MRGASAGLAAAAVLARRTASSPFRCSSFHLVLVRPCCTWARRPTSPASSSWSSGWLSMSASR
eukprot:6767735-Prymnesium_polylepis.1